MPSPVSFPVLRTPQTAQQSRVQDNVQDVLAPLAQRVGSTPIMGAPPPPWIKPSLLAGWSNLTTRVQSGFHKDALGYMHFRGYLAAGTLSAIAFVLPAGFRPGETVVFAPYVYNGAPTTGYLEVRTDGGVFLSGPVGTLELSLAGLTFLAER